MQVMSYYIQVEKYRHQLRSQCIIPGKTYLKDTFFFFKNMLKTKGKEGKVMSAYTVRQVPTDFYAREGCIPGP